MNFRLFIVTFERFGDVSYKGFIDLFFKYRYRSNTVDSDPHHHDVIISVNLIFMTTAVFLLIQTPIQRIFRGIRGTTVNIVPSRYLIANFNVLSI